MATISNNLGSISISNDVLAVIAGRSAEQCYGIVGMASKRAADGISQLLNIENYARGIKVRSSGDSVEIEMYIIVEYGVSINAVAQTAIDTVKYNIETMTGLKVSKVNVSVESVRV